MKTRRDFIKISATGAGVTALGLSAFGSKKFKFFQPNIEGPVSDEELTPYPTYCEVCFWKCAGWTYVDKSGRIRKIIGNKNDPHSLGRFCPRGTGGVGMYYDENLLKLLSFNFQISGITEILMIWLQAK